MENTKYRMEAMLSFLLIILGLLSDQTEDEILDVFVEVKVLLVECFHTYYGNFDSCFIFSFLQKGSSVSHLGFGWIY